MTWRSIETAPIARLEFDPMNEVILVGRKGEVPRVVSYEQGTWYLAEGQGGRLLYEPSHWMSLPTPPETKP